MSAFSHYFKDFAIFYDVTMAVYSSKSSSSICLLGRARIGVFSKSTRFIHQVHTIIDQLSHGYVTLLIFLDVH